MAFISHFALLNPVSKKVHKTRPFRSVGFGNPVTPDCRTRSSDWSVRVKGRVGFGNPSFPAICLAEPNCGLSYVSDGANRVQQHEQFRLPPALDGKSGSATPISPALALLNPIAGYAARVGRGESGSATEKRSSHGRTRLGRSAKQQMAEGRG